MLNVFQLAPNDQSVYYLGQIFGNVGIALTGTGPVLLSNMFKVFNTALLVLGTFLVAYVTVAGVLKTAQEGEPMGKQWSSLWLPLRMLMGIAGLVPTGSGYCAIQIVMMWIIVQGIGAADMVWNAAIDYFGVGGSLFTGTPPAPSDAAGILPRKMADLLKATTCQSVMVKAASDNANALASTQVIASAYRFNFGRVDPNDGAAATECGTMTLTGAGDPAGSKEDQQAKQSQLQAMQTIVPVLEVLSNYFVNQIIKDASCWKPCNSAVLDKGSDQYCTYFGKYNSFSPDTCSIFSNPDIAKDALLSQAGSNFISETGKLIYGYAQTYTTQAAVTKKTQGGLNPLAAAYKQAQVNGWIFAGSYYYYIASQSNPVNDAYNKFLGGINTTVNLPTNKSEKGDFSKFFDFAVKSANQAQTIAGMLSEDARAAVGTGGGIVVGTSAAGIPSEAGSFFGPLSDAAIAVANGFIRTLAPIGIPQDPLVKIHNFGHSLLITADQLFISFFVIGIGLGLASTVLVIFGTTVNPFEGIAKFLSAWIIPIVFFFMLYLIIVGGLLGIYLPLLPFMIFTFAAIGWFLTVIEAMVAAPVVAIGIMMPGGQHEIMGRAEASIMLLLNLFLTPVLLVFGMMSAMLLGIVLMQFVNGAFYTVLGTMGLSVGILEALLYMVAYVAIVITVMTKTYSLIHLLRENVITWVGGHARPGGEEQMAGEVKGTVGAGGSAAAKGAPRAVAGAFKGGALATKWARGRQPKGEEPGLAGPQGENPPPPKKGA